MIFKSRARRRFDQAARAWEALSAPHKEYSILSSAEDRPTPRRLLDLAIDAASRARDLDFSGFANRGSRESKWFDIWPGEHYKLLASLVSALGARRVIEIGTFTGMGSLALLEALPADGVLTTFDIKPWREIPDSWLNEADFASGRFKQEIADIGTPGVIARFADVFAEADFIFIDGPKDGVTEAKFIAALETLTLAKHAVVMFDDTRLLNMVAVWRAIARPKLDVTSFGHWSGSGLVDWNG